MTRTRPLIAAMLAAVAPIAGIGIAALAGTPAVAQDRWDWGGGGPDDRRGYDLAGRGVPLLYPELRDTRRGRAFVMRNFDFDRDGAIEPEEARAADRAFDRIAGNDRRGFDWDRHARVVEVPVAVPEPLPVDRGPIERGPVRGGGWDREGMRGYHFRQGRYGAMFTLQDVLFRTASAELRPGAEARLRPLAGYLRANPQVRLRIDGFTDSVGSAASNMTLSRDRARSVADTLSADGVDPRRLQLAGHGEADPVATNATAAGRQQNRRVEVTLIGQRATSFD